MAGSGPQKYPGASTAHWWQGTWGGDLMEVNVAVLHTTEGTSLPNYNGGSMAPNLTAVANFAKQRLDWYQHFDIDRSSRALQNLAGGVETNTLNVVQIEFEGTCDYAKRERWGSLVAGKDYIYWGDPPAWALRDAADFLKWLNANHGVPLTGPSMWLTYGPDSRRPGVTPASYGTSPARMSFTAWNSFKGVCGHMHVPENVHGDPGSLPFAQLIALAKGQITPPEDDVALTTDDINKVAAAVLAKLTDGNELITYLLTRDGVLKNPNPATAPTNPFIAVGTSLNNSEVVGRRADANVQALQAAVAQLQIGGVDLDALATKVADLLAARLAN